MTNMFNYVQQNLLFDEIMCEVQAKYKNILAYLLIANKAVNHCTTRSKLDTGTVGNLLLHCEFNHIFPNVSISYLAKMLNKKVTLEGYNNQKSSS